MPRFFISAPPTGDTIPITGEDARHLLRVLRMRVGETLTICDGAATDYACTLQQIDGDTAICAVQGQSASRGEPSVAVTLYMALPKGDKMDLIVQKAVELGAVRIVPYLSSRCVARPDDKTLQKRIGRWQKIANEAAMQSGRGILPQICDCLPFAQAIAQASTHAAALFLYENEQTLQLHTALTQNPLSTVAFLVGPEGGFAESEVEQAVAAGMQSVSLGTRILRCETAPLAAISAVMYQSGNM